RIMGDDSFGRINDAHELGDYPVGVDRPLIRMELGVPAAEPGFARCSKLVGDPVRARFAAQPVARRLDQLTEDELGIAENPEIGGEGFVQVARVVSGVDVFLAVWEDRGGDAVAGKAATDAEYEVRFVQNVTAGAGKGAAARPERQRVILGKRTL